MVGSVQAAFEGEILACAIAYIEISAIWNRKAASVLRGAMMHGFKSSLF